MTHAHAADGNSGAPHIPVGWGGGHQRGRPHCCVCSGVRQEQLSPTPAFLFPSRGRRIGSLDLAFLDFSTAGLESRPFCVLCAGQGAVGEEQNVPWALRCPEAMKKSSRPCFAFSGSCPAPSTSEAGLSLCTLLPAPGALVASGCRKAPRQGGGEGGTMARGHLHHRTPMGSRDPVPGSLLGQGITSAGWAGRGTGQRRRQREQGADCPSPVPPLPLGHARLCAHTCAPKGKCKQAGAVCHPR